MITAENGYEALMQIGAVRPHLLILDFKMPHMDGSEVYRQLKSSEATRDIRVLGISGYVDTDLQKLVSDSGSDCFMTKPIDPERFIAEAARMLDLAPKSNAS